MDAFFSSSSRESRLKITTAAFIQDGMKGPLALLCDERVLKHRVYFIRHGAYVEGVSEQGTDKTMFKPKVKKVSETWTKLLSECMRNLNSSSNQIYMGLTLTKMCDEQGG